jgi:ATP-dependent RNA helicase DHX57
LGVKAGKFKLVPLHSSLSSEQQAAVFEKPRHGVRKIVLSTNLAETSITIDDCVFVVEVGRMKEKRFDPLKSMESLDTVWVSRANALQRKGVKLTNKFNRFKKLDHFSSNLK